MEVDEMEGNMEATSLCESESSSIANLNYTGPDDIDSSERLEASRSSEGEAHHINLQDAIIVYWNPRYVFSFVGILRLTHVVLAAIALISLTTVKTSENQGYLLLPLNGLLKFMVFVLVLTGLSSFFIWLIKSFNIIQVFAVDWCLIDLVLYSVFTFLYLISSSMVYVALDFYQKSLTNVPDAMRSHLITCTAIGFVSMVLHGITTFLGFRSWKIQRQLFKRRQLLENEDF